MAYTNMTVRLDAATRERITVLAAKEHRSAASQVKYMLEKALDQIEAGESGQAKELRQFMEARA